MKREKASRRCDDDVLVDAKDREFVQPFLKYLIIIEYQQYCNPDDTKTEYLYDDVQYVR
jgi:hypothetical protein